MPFSLDFYYIGELEKERNAEKRIEGSLRKRLYEAIKNNDKTGHTMELLGCSIDEFKKHLQSKFQEGMSWENYGKWHIDHITPCARFDLSKPEEQKKSFHYTNLQPLWAKDNLSKGAKIPIISAYFNK